MYFEGLTKSEIKTIYDEAIKEYNDAKSKNLKLNMARGKPSAAQLELALGVLES